MIKLIEADEKYLEQYKEAYILSLQKIEEGLIKKHDLIFMNPDEIDIIQRMKDNRDKSKLKPTYVPSYDYFAVDEDKFIGVIHIRIDLTPALLQYGGNIGYGVNPKYWKQGYGTEILKLGLIKAQELIKSGKVLITCDVDNIGSYKIIEKNGGKLEGIVENTDKDETFMTRRYWINLKKKYDRTSEYCFVPYSDEYYDFVYEVKKNAYKKYVEECWGTWNEVEQKEYFEKFINAYKNSSYIIKVGDTAIGFYNDEELEDGSYEVGNICIIPEYQGQGIGTDILKRKLEEHKEQDIRIRFFKQNPVGALYEKLGFSLSGETEFHYQMIKPRQNVLKK